MPERSFSAERAAVIFITALFAILASILAWSLYQSYQAAILRINERVMTSSQIVATNAGWIDALAWQALRRIDDRLGPEVKTGGPAGVESVRDAVAGLPGSVQAYVVRADGMTLFSTDPEVKPIDIRDREYFSELAKGASEYISPLLVSRLNGEQIFVYSRRLQRGGKFAGAAMVSFSADVLRSVWDVVNLGPGSTVSIMRPDGKVVARYPKPPGPIDLGDYILFTDYLKKSDQGVYEAVSPADGTRRLVGYRRVPGTNLVVQASAAYDENMSEFWRSLYFTVSFAAATAIGLAVGAAWIASLLKRDAIRNRALERALDQNQMLMREIHHRVKNNLQVIQSLIRLQPLPAEVKNGLFDRLSAMSSVHEHIYRYDRFSEISADTLIPSVIDPLVRAYKPDVLVDYDLDACPVSNDQATSLALLVGEVTTNALKYAFADGAAGKLDVRLKAIDGGRVRLEIQDNGPGFDPAANTPGMGTRLIAASVQQLSGHYGYEIGNGTRFHAELRLV
jgi:two-component system, sensor histidine kinase PdtaS